MVKVSKGFNINLKLIFVQRRRRYIPLNCLLLLFIAGFDRRFFFQWLQWPEAQRILWFDGKEQEVVI